MVNQNKSRLAKSAKDLEVYGLAYDLAMDIFEISKAWPKEEKYALTDQIRRSSRSVCANLREAWAKRRYPAHFLSKLTDADAENSETDTWLSLLKIQSVSLSSNISSSPTRPPLWAACLGQCLKISNHFAKMTENLALSSLPITDLRFPTTGYR